MQQIEQAVARSDFDYARQLARDMRTRSTRAERRQMLRERRRDAQLGGQEQRRPVEGVAGETPVGPPPEQTGEEVGDRKGQPLSVPLAQVPARSGGEPEPAEQPEAQKLSPEEEAAQEAERQMQLQQEQAQSMRDLERMGGRRNLGLNDDEMKRVAERGRGVAKRFSAAAEKDSDWPFIFVIVLSLINDVIDIFDVSLGLGLDQIFDFFMFALMLGARLFVRQQSGWVASKIASLIVEWIPFVGILPCWTIAAVYVYRRALRLRRQRQAQAARERQAEYAMMTEEQMEMAEEPV